MIKSAQITSGFPLQLPAFKDKPVFKFNEKFNVIFGENGCLAKGTLISTTGGIKPIEKITVDDYVYDEFGNPIKVLHTFNTGTKKVVELTYEGKVWAECSYDHVWLSKNKSQKIPKGHRTIDFNTKEQYIKRIIPNKIFGNIEFRDAYILGAMIGDGCCVQSTKQYHISSADESVVKHISVLSNGSYHKIPGNNYTWEIKPASIPILYYEWCKNKKAHEKICDYSTIIKWNRESILQFIAGLIDTDGCVSSIKGHRIYIDISMQAKSVIDCLQKLFFDIWGTHTILEEDAREKYKNGSCFGFSIKRRQDVFYILRDLEKYLQVPRKKQMFQKISGSARQIGFLSVQLGKEKYKQTYDIHVDSDTNLYCLANGLITHNSGKSVLLKTIAAFCGIEKAGWTAISDPMKLGYDKPTQIPYVYRQYTPGSNIDAIVDWDGQPSFYNDSDMVSKNDTTWFFSNMDQSGDGLTTESEQMDILAARPSSGQFRVHKLNKIMQVIKTPPNLMIVPPQIQNKTLAQLEINYILSLPRNGKITLLLDEPEKALALPKQLELFNTINTLAEWFQIIMVSHSPFILFYKGANIIDINDGYAKLCKDIIRKQVKPNK